MRRERPIPPSHSLTISVVCFVLALICLGFILAGCSVKHAQIAHASLQGADLVSTAVAESRGAVEANPVLQTNWPVRVALKSLTTTLVIYGTSKLAKEHQMAAKAVLFTLNAVLTGVIVNNVLVGRGRR